jgi:glutamate 5-kinase
MHRAYLLHLGTSARNSREKAATEQLSRTHSGRSFARRQRIQDDSVKGRATYRQKFMNTKTELINLRQQLRRARTIVVKVGTKVLVQPDGSVAIDVLKEVVKSVGTLRMSGRRVLLVSSGAIGIGSRRLSVSSDMVPVCAAAGQSALTALYHVEFGNLGIAAAQVLVTDDDFRDLERHKRLCHTLSYLTRLGVVPIINENHLATHSDAKTEERAFSENDMLASLVAAATRADLLVLLTDVDGVYTEHPTGARAALIPEMTGTVHEIGLNEQVGELSRGGIRAKLHAVARAIESTRLFAVIANGRTPEVLEHIVQGHQIGTLIAPEEVQ